MKAFSVIMQFALVITSFLIVGKMSQDSNRRPKWASEVVGVNGQGHPEYGVKLWLLLGLAVFAAVLASNLVCQCFMTQSLYDNLIYTHREDFRTIGYWFAVTLVGPKIFNSTTTRGKRTLFGAAAGFGVGLIAIGVIATVSKM